MLKITKLGFLIVALTVVSASGFADQDLYTYGKKGTLAIYHHAIKPIPKWIKKSVKGAVDGTIFVTVKLGEGGKAVGEAFYKSGDAVVTHVVDPVGEATVRSLVALVKLGTYDTVWNLVAVPLKDGVEAAQGTDLETGLKAIGTTELKSGKYLGSDLKANGVTIKKNARSVYEVTAVPVYKGTVSAGKTVVKVIVGG